MKVRVVIARTRKVRQILYVATESPIKSLLGLMRLECRPDGAGIAGMRAGFASSGMVPLMTEVL